MYNLYKVFFYAGVALGVILFIALIKISVEDYLSKKEKEVKEEKK